MIPVEAPRNCRQPSSRGVILRQRHLGQGSNSVQVRHGNERVILTLLRRLGTAAKADLARHANLTANTVGQIVQGLETAGLVRSDGKRHGERGQPATLLCLDPQGACSIGVKAGRRSLDTILVDFTGRVLAQRHRECPFPAAGAGCRHAGRRHCGRAWHPCCRPPPGASRRPGHCYPLQPGLLAARTRHPDRSLSGLERLRSRGTAGGRNRTADL